MNQLQSLKTDVPLFLTLNPVREPLEKYIIREFDYTHPLFDMEALATQSHLWSLQGIGIPGIAEVISVPVSTKTPCNLASRSANSWAARRGLGMSRT